MRRFRDLPEYRDVPAQGVDPLARFLDYSPETKTLVVAEENVLGDPAEPRVGPNQVIRLLALAVHDVVGTRPVDPNWDKRGRAVQQYELRVKRLDVRFDERLAALYKDGAQRREMERHRGRPRSPGILGDGRAGVLRRPGPGRNST